MTEPNEGTRSERDVSPVPKQNTYEIVEGRTNYRMWIPRYIHGRFAERIGSTAAAVYGSLAWWCCSDAPHHAPSLAEIGTKAGCSRATVWRTLPVLVRAHLIELVPVVGKTGRRPHQIRLIHPPEVIAPDTDPGTDNAGGSNLSAPTGSESDPNVCVNAPPADTHTSAPPSPPLLGIATADFVDAWMRALPGGSKRHRAAHEQEAREWGARLLAVGWQLLDLLRDLDAPDRDVNEWPRVYAARHDAAALQAAQRSAAATEERQTRAGAKLQERKEAARRLAAHARWEALQGEEQAQRLARAVEKRPELRGRPALAKLYAQDLLAAELLDNGAAELLDNGAAELPKRERME